MLSPPAPWNHSLNKPVIVVEEALAATKCWSRPDAGFAGEAAGRPISCWRESALHFLNDTNAVADRVCLSILKDNYASTSPRSV